MKKIDIVITMGGLGSRFRKQGFKVPKYMIEVRGRTLFEWSLMSLDGYKEDVNQYVFVVMKDEDTDVREFIREKCLSLGIQNYKVVILDYLTDGQATTAYLATKYLVDENALIIYNIDTYVEPGLMNSEELKGDGFIPCFQASGDHWSFVKIGDNGKAVEIVEKKRISNYCTLGAYYFKTCKLYIDLYMEYYSNSENSVNGEKYVAPLYNHLVSKGGEVYISDVDPEKVHVLGTPEELQVFIDGSCNL